MKKSSFKSLLCLVSVLFILLFPSCSAQSVSAEEILYEICASLELPAGQTYLLRAAEGEKNYLSADTAGTLYGEKAVNETFPLLEDYAIYLSSSLPCEIAVFRCYSRSDTDKVSAMCLERADALGALMKNTEFYELYQNAEIITHKKYVLMLLCEDTDRAFDEARKALE